MRRLALGVAAAIVLVSGSSRADDVSACVGAFDGSQKAAAAGKLLTARELLDVCSGPACPAPLRADCIQRRDELERLVPTAAFVVRDANGLDVDATVAVDGAQVQALGRTVPLEPGPHVVAYTTPDGVRHEQRIVAAEGEKARVIVLHVGALPPAAATRPAEPEERRSNAVPWVLLGTGAGLVVVGGVLAFAAAVDWGDTKQRYQSAFDFCDSETCRSSTHSAYGDAKDRTVVREGIALGMVTVGLVAGAIGVTLLASPDHGKPRASLAPMLGPTNGAALSGSF